MDFDFVCKVWKGKSIPKITINPILLGSKELTMLNVNAPHITFISLKNEFQAENPIGEQQAEMLTFEEMFVRVKSLSVEEQAQVFDEMDCWCKSHFFTHIDGNWGEQSQAFWGRKRDEKREFEDFIERVTDHTWTTKIPTDFGGWFWE